MLEGLAWTLGDCETVGLVLGGLAASNRDNLDDGVVPFAGEKRGGDHVGRVLARFNAEGDGIEFYSHRIEDATAILEWGEEEIAARLESEPAERKSAPAQLIAIDHTEMVPHNRQNLRRIEYTARSGARLGVAVTLCGQLDSWWVPDEGAVGVLLRHLV